MHIRSKGLGLLGGLALIVSACSGAASPSPSTAPSTAPSVAPSSAAPSESAAASPSASASNLKIGVVTDVGTINDKNFNEYTYKGAQQGAQDVGVSGDIPYAVPKDASEYPTLINNYVTQGFNVIVTTGFNLTNDTIAAAKKNPDVWFIGVDQAPICIDEQGAPDSTFACKGDPKTLLPKYVALGFQEDQAGYLAGIVAASVSKSGTIGAIGGITLCAPCVRYIQGYELGAKSVNSSINVKTAYITTSDFKKAFADPVTGKNFAKQFISQNKPDVLFQVAGLTGNGILDAACEAGIYGVGVDVDQFLSYPNAAKCLITSAEKHLANAVDQVIKAIAAGSQQPGDAKFDATNDGIGASPGHDLASKWPSDLQGKLDAALAGMKDGSVKTCPDTGCGAPPK
ncbi:MAG TPA: BMP family ABC transporter substrate-binding protein [Candidatus Limnocylindrales bacterium]|nr:BMP family ABC transporter substrate-binding protein [Candidatus Limnocylindrales bacterium]